MRGVILAAGLGTRLLPLTLLRAKPAIPFLNRPLLRYALDLLQGAGIGEIAINLHHLPDTVVRAVPGDVNIHYSRERTILGTGGVLAKLRDWLQGDDFVVCNGKIYFEEDLRRAVEYHRSTGALATLVLVPHLPDAPFRPVFADSRHNITAFGQARGIVDETERAFTFTGLHVLSSRVLDYLSEGPSDTVRDLYPLLLRQGHCLKGYLSSAYWCECSTPSRYLVHSGATLQHKGLSNLMANETSASCDRVIAGSDTRIGVGSELRNCLLWEGCRIGRDCSLADAIITSGVELPPGTRLQRSIVTPPVPHWTNTPPRPLPGTAHWIWPLEESA